MYRSGYLGYTSCLCCQFCIIWIHCEWVFSKCSSTFDLSKNQDNILTVFNLGIQSKCVTLSRFVKTELVVSEIALLNLKYGVSSQYICFCQDSQLTFCCSNAEIRSLCAKFDSNLHPENPARFSESWHYVVSEKSLDVTCSAERLQSP